MLKLNEIIFYTIEKSIKTYRQFAQREINEAGYDITIDQWLVMSCLMEEPDMQLQQLASKVFKDNASITRIIELLIEKNYLKKQANPNDGRRSTIIITAAGQKIIGEVQKIVMQYRKQALKGIPPEQIELTKQVLNLITENCKK